MIDKGEYQTPEPYQDLNNGIKMMQQAYLLYRTQNAPEERLDLFRRWIEDAQELMTMAATPEQAALPEMPLDPTMDGMPLDPALAGMPLDPALAGGQPVMAEPEALPTSELLPNTQI